MTIRIRSAEATSWVSGGIRPEIHACKDDSAASQEQRSNRLMEEQGAESDHPQREEQESLGRGRCRPTRQDIQNQDDTPIDPGR